MKELTHIIQSYIGMNPRRALLFSNKMRNFESHVTVLRGDGSCNGKDVYQLLNLGIVKNDTIIVKIAGSDEETAASVAEVVLWECL
jgi:phosphotransferase system HPr (HPr) family protein